MKSRTRSMHTFWYVDLHIIQVVHKAKNMGASSVSTKCIINVLPMKNLQSHTGKGDLMMTLLVIVI